VDPLAEEEDIFLSQTEEEVQQEAAIEAAVCREVFGTPKLADVFAKFRNSSSSTSTREEEEQEGRTGDEVDTASTKRKRTEDENEERTNPTGQDNHGGHKDQEEKVSEPTNKKKMKPDHEISATA